MARNNPMIMASLEKKCFEHISLMAQEQVEVEFRQEMQQTNAMQTKSTSNAELHKCKCRLKMISEKIEARKAQLIADMMEEFTRRREENYFTI